MAFKLSICHCGMETTKKQNHEYCGEFCRLFVEGNHEKVKGRFPKIPVPCSMCGESILARKGEGYVKHFCSSECRKELNTSPVRRPLMNHYMLFYLKRHGDWISSQALSNILSRHGHHGNSGRWSGLLARWVRLGADEMRKMQGSSASEYRFNPKVQTPLAKIVVQRGI